MLKQLLFYYILSFLKRVDKLLSVPGLGEGLTVDLMDNLLSWLGLDKGGFLFPHIFLNQLLPSV